MFAVAGLLESVHGYIGYTLSGRPAFGYTLRGQPLSFAGILARALPSWIILGVLAAIALRLARRRPLFSADWKRSLLFHLPLAVLFASAFLLAAAGLRHFLFLRSEVGVGFGTTLLRYYAVYFNSQFILYWGTVGVYSALLYQQDLRERALAEERLQRGLTEARLRALQQQLQPHFLYNTLNAITGLALEGDVRGTVRTLALLGDLLRATLDRKEPVVTLAEELELLDLYLAIQRVRLEERLTVSTAVAPDVLDAEVPTFLLQPLVENAIRHGIAPLARGGRVEISASRELGRVRVCVTDSGPGLAGRPVRPGIGLRNCIERLEQLYGEDYGFRLEDGQPTGARVWVEWPLRRRGRVGAPSPVASRASAAEGLLPLRRPEPQV